MSFDIGDGERGKFVFDKETKSLVPYKEKPKVKESDVQIVMNSLGYKQKGKRTNANGFISDEVKGEPLQCPLCFIPRKFEFYSGYYRHLKDFHPDYKITGTTETGSKESWIDKKKRIEEQRQEIRKDYYDIKYGRIKFTEAEKAHFEEEKRKWGKAYMLKPPE